MSVTRWEIAEKLYNKGENPTVGPLSPDYKIQAENSLIENFAGETNLSKRNLLNFKTTATNFAAKVRMFYKENGPCTEKMFDKKKLWFDTIIKNPLENSKPGPGRPVNKNPGGAPKKDYASSGDKSKTEKAKKVGIDHSLEKMLHATLLKARELGLTDVAWVLDSLKDNPIEHGHEFRECVENPPPKIVAFTPEESLATILELRLTQKGYKKLRQKEKKKGAKLYVSWHEIDKIKNKSKPKNIKKDVNGEVSVPLQEFVDHQAQEIMDLPEVRAKYDKLVESGQDFELVFFGKYGYDGTQTKTVYYNTDAGIFLCCLYLGFTRLDKQVEYWSFGFALIN